ncbi:uncharacterized protein LOC129757288 isoform X1 [Uranotaenia lowii]|uniref:uncharacterized protein LOC129757288 isoform X1 n=1 Tax=Uranotaenia lowii TaxID=190385 RepID=UPI0024792E34|nr:uncharacterized protein LOC129757288 isoform X1 [Uranotaenia lowii]
MSDSEENPFIEALGSEALRELLQDTEKREMAEKLTENLKSLSGMFTTLSDSEKKMFATEFKGQFVKQLQALQNMVKEQKVVKANEQAQQSIPQFGSTDSFNEEVNLYIIISFGVLIVLFIVFFGYKLYLSLTEKERKREEKLKAKQAKKKK